MFFTMSPTKLSTFLQAKFMRCLLIVKVLSEKHSNTLWRMQYGVTNLNKHAQEGGMALKKMKVRRHDLKVIAEGVTTHVYVQRGWLE